MLNEMVYDQGESALDMRFCGIINPELMVQYERPDLRPDIAAQLNVIQEGRKRTYVEFMHMPLRIEHFEEGPGNQVWSFIVEGAPGSDGVYSCASLSIIKHANGRTYGERHCARERKTETGEIEVIEPWALAPEDVHPADMADDDFIFRVAREAKPLPVAA